MRNYHRENVARYREMTDRGVSAWAEAKYGGTDYVDFSSRGFLEDAIPRLRLDRDRRSALELGTGVGPGAFFLAARGLRVHAIDLIPEAIEQARLIASERGVEVDFGVMDVTRIPHDGPAYDLIVDSYCLQGIVLDADREAVLRAVRGRLDPRGYYLLSTAMYDAARHRPDRQVVERGTGRVFDGYDDDCLYDPDTDVCYWPYDGEAEIDDAITVDGARFFPARRYRNGPRLLAALGGELRPGLEAGVRYDGGDAERGAGLVLGGSVSYRQPAWGLSLEASGQGLLRPESWEFSEWGAAGTLRLDPGEPGLGMALSVAPAWGTAASGGAERLWRMPDAAALAAGGAAAAAGAGRLEAELSYGLEVSGGSGLLTPYAGVGVTEAGGRTWRTGARVSVAPGLSVGVEGTRSEPSAAGAAEHTFTLNGQLRW